MSTFPRPGYFGPDDFRRSKDMGMNYSPYYGRNPSARLRPATGGGPPSDSARPPAARRTTAGSRTRARPGVLPKRDRLLAGLAALALTAVGMAITRPAEAVSDGADPVRSGFTAALIDSKGGMRCTAAIVNQHWALTSAHCIDLNGMELLYGSTKSPLGTRIGVLTWVVAPHGDLAAIYSAGPMNPPTFASPAQNSLAIGTQGELSPWGTADIGGPAATALQYAGVTITSYRKDLKGGPGLQVKPGDGIANTGDSGGPLMVGNDVVGVFSHGDDAASGYAVYSQVASWRTWISRTVGS